MVKTNTKTTNKNWLYKLLVLLNIMLVIATCMAYVAPHIRPDTIWLFSFFGLFYPIMLIANFGFILLWAFKDIRYSLLSLLTIAVGWSFLKSFLVFNTTSITKNPHEISVISYNIGNANEAYDKKKEVKLSKEAKMYDYLKRFNDEDVLCLQEVGNYATDILKKSFTSYFFHQTQKGAVILSKHKIINKGQIDFGTITNSCVWVDILVDLDTIRVYSLHLQSNQISKDANEVIDHGKVNDRKTWDGITGILKKYRYTHQTRANQAQLVRQHLEKSPYPTIVCGDFNDTPVSYTYQHLTDGLQDAFVKKGNGIGSTFNGRIPFLRIDYIITTPDFKIDKYNVIKENYSDHYAIASLISL